MIKEAREHAMRLWRSHGRTFTRSSIASLVATGAEFTLLPICIRLLAFPHWVAYGTVQFVGTLITFLLGRYWSFEAGSAALAMQSARYAVVFGGSFALNTALPSIGSYLVHLEPVVSFAISQVLVYVFWNYPMNKYWVFRS